MWLYETIDGGRIKTFYIPLRQEQSTWNVKNVVTLAAVTSDKYNTIY